MDTHVQKRLARVMTRSVDADYLVVGAGAAGLAFTDALIDHADARVALVDRRHDVGGHWVDAYPFARLHLPSAFYGVASTPLGGGRVQQGGPEAGLHVRASKPELLAYYARVLDDRMLTSGKVEFFGGCDYLGDRRFVSRVSGQAFEVPARCRVVDARLMSPDIPSTTPPPFAVADDARVIALNDLVDVREAPSEYVVVGSGKTATDACLWLLAHGVDPGAICWVRPREPWMIDRVLVVPDPVAMVGLGLAIMEAAAGAGSVDDLFLGLEDAGIMMRLDPSVVPTMAKVPMLATWELAQLRTIENVVRRGHLRRAERGRLVFDDGSVEVADDAVVVHCAASGLKYPPPEPIFAPPAITLQPILNLPCFSAALVGYVEATREGDADKNALCLPTSLSDTLPGWAAMNAMNARAEAAFNSAPDVKAWARSSPINPGHVPSDYADQAALDALLERIEQVAPDGLARMAELGGSAA